MTTASVLDRPVEHVTFRAGPLGRPLLERGAVGTTARRMAERYLMLAGSVDVAAFTPDQAQLLLAVLRDAPVTVELLTDPVPFLRLVTDRIRRDRLDDLHRVDAQELRSTLAVMLAADDLAALALVDAAERYWRDPTVPDALARTGLVRVREDVRA